METTPPPTTTMAPEAGESPSRMSTGMGTGLVGVSDFERELGIE
jgi:hypothetical protein